ncbi:MAG: hypothetical protein M1135_01805 [Candidatus Omnitrophica bacterium]|jgi:hypothetical protein|nr:hypothetical protein [Candidatus Omnitrophota bacterium]
MKTREDILKILSMEKPALEKQFKLKQIALVICKVKFTQGCKVKSTHSKDIYRCY